MIALLYFFTERAYAFGVGVPIGGASSFTKFDTYINALLKYGITLGLVLSTMMFIWAGIKYITSQGNPTAISDAKDIVVGTMIGFLMLVLMRALLQFFIGK